MYGGRSAAEQFAIRGQAPYGRDAAVEADSAVGDGEAEVRVSADRLAASRRGMASGVVASASPVAAGGSESAWKEAEEASSGLQHQRMPSETGGGPEQRVVLGLRVRPDVKR